MSDELMRLKLEVQGQDQAKSLSAQLQSVDAATKALDASYKKGKVTSEEYLHASERLRLGKQSLEQQVRREGEALGTFTVATGQAGRAFDELDKKSGKASSGMAGLGQAGMQTGRVIQDFAQGGIGGVLNNIEGFVQSVGGGPGLAGALTILGVAFYALKPAITSWMQGIREAQGVADPLKLTLTHLDEQLESLKSKKVKFAFDLDQLDAIESRIKGIKEGLAEADRADKSKTHFQEESEKNIGDILKNATGGGLPALKESLRKSLEEDLKANDPAYLAASAAELKKKQDIAQGIADAKAQGMNAGAADFDPWDELGKLSSNRRIAERDVSLRANAEAGNIVGGKRGTEALRQALNRIGRDDLADDISHVTAGKIEESESIDTEGMNEKIKESGKELTEQRQAREKKAKEAADEAKKAQDKAKHDADQAKHKADQAKHEADQAKAKHDREIQQSASDIANHFGDNLLPQAQRMIFDNLQNRASGKRSFTDKQMEDRIAKEAGKVFSQMGAVDRDGRGLGVAGNVIAGRELAQKALQTFLEANPQFAATNRRLPRNAELKPKRAGFGGLQSIAPEAAEDQQADIAQESLQLNGAALQSSAKLNARQQRQGDQIAAMKAQWERLNQSISNPPRNPAVDYAGNFGP